MQAACDRAFQAGLMAKVGQVDQDALLTLAEAPCPRVRATSIYALGETRDSRAVPTLIGRLGDQDQDVRRISARALGMLSDIRAAQALMRASKYEHGSLQASAQNALHNMKGFLALKDQMAQTR